MDKEIRLRHIIINYRCEILTFDEAINKILLLFDVSGRSEQLLAFAEWLKNDTITGLIGEPQYYVERYLKANNCH